MIIRKAIQQNAPVLHIDKAKERTDEVSKIAQALTLALQPRDGVDGIDGRNVELRKVDNALEWRQEEEQWQELLSLADVKGDRGEQGFKGIDGKNGLNGIDGKQGNAGKNGKDGEDGEDGETVDLRKTKTHIQWKHENDKSWKNLVSLAEIKGPKGDSGKGQTIISAGAYGGLQYTIAYGADATATRPANTMPIVWVGSVEPINAIDNDLWVNTS